MRTVKPKKAMIVVRKMKWGKTVLALIVGLGLMLSQGAAFAKSVTARQWRTELTNHGVKASLSQYKGQVVWLDFWASWCAPCRASFPWLNEMQRRYGPRGFKVIAINLDENSSDAEQFLKALPADFQVFFDPAGKAPEAFDIKGMPTSVLIDRQGNIHMFHVGFRKAQEAELERQIRQTLGLDVMARNH